MLAAQQRQEFFHHTRHQASMRRVAGLRRSFLLFRPQRLIPKHCQNPPSRGSKQKYASDPRPPHTRQKYEQTSGQNMTPNALKQGQFGSLGAIFLFIFLPCMWGLGVAKRIPIKADGSKTLSSRSVLCEMSCFGKLFLCWSLVLEPSPHSSNLKSLAV